jgi:hypothetical protein
MKKLSYLVPLTLIIIVLFMVTPASSIKPPPGWHYSFNCVTDLGPFIDSFDGDLFYWTNLTGTASVVEIDDDNVFQHVGGSYVGAVTTIAGSASWDNYVFQFNVMKQAGTYFNVVFRYGDGSNHYMLEGGSSGGNAIALFKWVGGVKTELIRPPQVTVNSAWYHYMIILDGTSIQVWVDNVKVIDIFDGSLSAGKVGIGGYASTVYFDNVIVEGPNVKVAKPNEILVPFVGTGKLGWVEGSSFQILDNDMTDGQAWVQVPSGLYDTYDQARGKPGGYMYWGNNHARVTKKPVWEQHNDDLNWWEGRTGNWVYTNNKVTCYSFRLYPLYPLW